AGIPKTSSGKIQRHACRIGFLNGSLDVVGNWTANLEQTDLMQLHEARGSSAISQQRSEQVRKHESGSNSAVENFQEEGQSSKPTFTKEEIQTWLISRLALYLKMPPAEINIQTSFTEYGLDSAVAVSMTGELGQWLGCELGLVLLWEYPSIEKLTQYLVAEYQLLDS
ncbi:MAG TPA: AMP-dependent synthetase, partial [Cyanobacteria bacterium UBA11049]|nr:AMP-dependent synthetase [Cyanobacteria bacterium UBA11049]